MLLSLAVVHAVGILFVASESTQDTSANILGEKQLKSNKGALSFYASVNNSPPPVVNKTYYDKDENPLRIPKQFYEERKKKSRITKSPKRTIQRIIKNGKSRNRKIYVHPMTRQPTQSSINVDITETYTKRNKIVRVPTEHSHKKKPRKNSKIARYPMPFQKFQTRKGIINQNNNKRNKRDVVRDDFFIFKDLDEMEFLSKEKDYDVVKAHIKNYW